MEVLINHLKKKSFWSCDLTNHMPEVIVNWCFKALELSNKKNFRVAFYSSRVDGLVVGDWKLPVTSSVESSTRKEKNLFVFARQTLPLGGGFDAVCVFKEPLKYRTIVKIFSVRRFFLLDFISGSFSQNIIFTLITMG